MARDDTDFVEEFVASLDNKDDSGHFRDLPLKFELSLKSKRHLKREVWDNAKKHGWLPQ